MSQTRPSDPRNEQDKDGHLRENSLSSVSGPQKKAEGKDSWDKFSTVSTLLSTILIAAVGGYFTHRFEERQAEAQRKIQETQAVAQLMQYLTGTDQQQKRAFVAIKVLGNTKLMVDLAASDPRAAGAREALRDVEFHAADPKDRDLAISLLSQFEFAPSCALPFQEVARSHAIDFSDHSCGMWGNSPSDRLRLQNFVKNNFCAGTAFRDMTATDFVTLQQRADATGVGGGNIAGLPKDRTALKKVANTLGEGTAVRFTGYIMAAHYSDVGRGESVNCNLSDIGGNDIHIDLVSKADETDHCNSITAEISPHMRPADWELANLESLAQQKALVRIGGQLMYDASHRPCSGNIKVVPQRLSTWEIHPVYSVEICPTAEKGSCPGAQWLPLAPPPTR